MNRKRVLLLTLLLLLSALASCGEETTPTPIVIVVTPGPPSGQVTVVVTPPPVPEAGIEVLGAAFAHGLGEDMQPVDPGADFAPNETVYLSLKIKGRPPAGLVTARFYSRDTLIVEADVDLADANSGLLFSVGENTYAGYTLTHEQPFSLSDNYRAEVLYEGQPLGSYPFRVVPPPEAIPSQVKQVVLARGADENYDPVEPTTAFAFDETVHLVARGDLGVGTWLQAEWYVDGQLDEAGTRNLTVEENLQDVGFAFSLLPEGGWPPGEHSAVLIMNDREVGHYTFTITSSGAAAPFDEDAFWDTFPFPEDAEFGAVVQGYDAGFATAMTEPEIFDAYAAWFREKGWQQLVPMEAISTLPHQVWRNDGAEFLLEIRGLDEAGRTVVWVLATLEPGVVVPQPAPLPSTTASPMTGGWLAKHGGPDGARANRDAHLRLPLALAWEWGGDGLNMPEAVAIADGRVFLLTSRGELCILDTETGMEQRCQFLWPDEQAIASTTGLVALSGDTIVVSAMETYIEPGQDHASIRSRLATFSWDGEPGWVLPPAEDQTGNALVPREGLVVSATSDGAGDYWLVAFDTASGAEQWRVLGSFALGASDGANLYTERVAALGLDAGERLWRHKTDAQYVAYADGYLYAAGDNTLTCLQAETGQVLWQTGFGAFLYSVDYIGIVVAHDHVYLIPEVGATHHGYRAGVMALDAVTGQEQWSALTDEGKSAGFLAASADSVVVIGTDYDTFTEQLWVLDASDGAELDRVTLGDLDVRGLAVAGEQVYVLGPTLLVFGPGR